MLAIALRVSVHVQTLDDRFSMLTTMPSVLSISISFSMQLQTELPIPRRRHRLGCFANDQLDRKCHLHCNAQHRSSSIVDRSAQSVSLKSTMSRERSFIMLSTATSASLIAVSLCYLWQRRVLDDVTRELEAKRLEERTGRIRAEVKLRNALNREKQLSDSSGEVHSTNSHDAHAMKLSTIGKIVSPFTKRMGTPRQGMLVPSSRGYLQFSPTLPAEAVDGISEYSHIWIIFAFHENTSLATSQKSKIRPPRGGGIKVGQLATRSPHRPNDLGLSLVKLERWDPSMKRLHISALDLVDGTPVYDIKPYVHWDIPAVVDFDASKLRVPSWVENQDDVLPKVDFTKDADAVMEDYFEFDYLAPLYPSNDPTALEAAMQTLREILAQDPRSSHKGVSKNQRGSISLEPYRLLFCRLEIEFMVGESGAIVVGMRKAPDRDVLLSPTKAVTPQKGSRSIFADKLPTSEPY